MFSIKIYRRDIFKAENEAYQNYYATFQNDHAAKVYAEGLQDNISAYRINVINDNTGLVVQSMIAVQHKRSTRFNDSYFRWERDKDQ